MPVFECHSCKKSLILLGLLFFLFPLSLAQDTYDSCTYCHSNFTKMKSMGYPQFYFTQEEVWRESGMFREGLGGPRCYDCHLGDKTNFTLEGAHKGILTLLVINYSKLVPISNRTKYLRMIAKQQNRTPSMLIPKLRGTKIKTILFHDRDAKTLAFSPEIANKTCGKCHSGEFEDYIKSRMAEQRFSRRYSSFTSPSPHNCGYWNHNYSMARELVVEYTKDQMDVLQRKCEQCHTSCLDCHYSPLTSRHAFTRRPGAQTCASGGGRGICHNGAEEHRRGAGYFREEASPPPLPHDIHVDLNLSCLDCHTFYRHDISREAHCKDCHREIEEELKESVHRNLTCEACHITEVGGYQMVYWAPGKQFGIITPLAKIIYYGVEETPLLIMDHGRKWIPVKVVPHGVLNVNETLNKTGIKFRDFPDRKSEDAYAIELGEDHKIFWLHMDKCSHGFGKARGCKSCHKENGEQRIVTNWTMWGFYVYPELKKIFHGKTLIIANRTGLYLYISNTTPISREDLSHHSTFAPWLEHNTWYIQGDFSLPPSGKECKDKCESCHSITAHSVVSGKERKEREYLLVILIFWIILCSIIILKGKEGG